MSPSPQKLRSRASTNLGQIVLSGFLASVLLATFASIESQAASPDKHPQPLPTVSVRDFGAKGDGIADDRPAVQAAIDSLANGGTVSFPAGTYLMDSYITAKSNDHFNLVTSHDNLTLEPAPGAPAGSVRLVQGPHGWGVPNGPRVFGPLAVFNSEFFLASRIGQNGYQNAGQNGGFFTLQSPILPQSQSVTFSTKADAGHFAEGDWIAIALTSDQNYQNVGIVPLEINQVVSVNAETGAVGLRWPQVQSYPTGFAAKVTHMVRSNITVRGLTLQGVIPIFLNDLYNFNMIDCNLLCDVTYAAPRKGTYMFANGVRQMLFKDNIVSDFPPGSVANVDGVELPQNGSMDITIEHNTFHASAGGGEYWVHWVIKDNNFLISPPPSGKHHGLCMQGYDILFEGNTLTSTADLDYLYSDFSTAPNRHKWLFGAQKIRNNRFCSAVGANAVRIYSPDTEFSGNVVVSGPEQRGLLVTISGRMHQDIPRSEVKAANVITNNTFYCAANKASGCVLLSGPSLGGIAFSGNSLFGYNDSAHGVRIQSESDDEALMALVLGGNHYVGFKTPVFNVPKPLGEKPKNAGQ
jgi:hypothetical protein